MKNEMASALFSQWPLDVSASGGFSFIRAVSRAACRGTFLSGCGLPGPAVATRDAGHGGPIFFLFL